MTNGKVGKAVQAQLEEGLAMRSKAKMMEDEARVIKDEANPMIESALGILGINSYGVEGVGTVRVKKGTSTSLNKTLLTEILLSKGVDYKVVTEAISDATKTTSYTSVEYRVK